MRQLLKARCWVLPVLLFMTMNANAIDLRLLVDTSVEMPLAEIRDDKVIGGLHEDIGQLLAHGLGRRAKFILLPRKRIAAALASGEADILCDYLPEWMPGPFLWSQAFIPNEDVLVTVRQAAPPLNIAALANKPVGTVLGFSYPDMEKALGEKFIRDDAPSATNLLRMLDAGRMQYAVINRDFLQYKIRNGVFNLPLHPYLVVSAAKTSCALSPHSKITLAELDAVIDKVIADGSLKRLLDAYRQSLRK